MNDDTDPPAVSSRTISAELFMPVVFLAAIGGFIITLATALRTLARAWWIADIFCQFTVQYVLLLCPILLVMLVAKAWKRAAFFGVVFAINLLVIWPYIIYAPNGSGASTATRPAGPVYRLLTQNVLTSNRDYQRVLDLIELEQPDFVVLLEIDGGWVDALQKLHVEYPYRITKIHPGNFGIGFYSRHSWSHCELTTPGPDQLPTVFAEFLKGTQDSGQSPAGDNVFYLVGTHPVPPLDGPRAESRNRQLDEVVGDIPRNRPRIVTGDFNLTPWSPWFRNLLVSGELRDAAIGFGIQPTWHIFPTILGGVKIDHCLVDRIYVTDYRVGPDVNSDHRAVILDFIPGFEE